MFLNNTFVLETPIFNAETLREIGNEVKQVSAPLAILLVLDFAYGDGSSHTPSVLGSGWGPCNPGRPLRVAHPPDCRIGTERAHDQFQSFPGIFLTLRQGSYPQAGGDPVLCREGNRSSGKVGGGPNRVWPPSSNPWDFWAVLILWISL